VFQNVQLLPLTIAENVSSGTKENMDREKVINCLKLAGLWEKIEDFPDKKYLAWERDTEKCSRAFRWRAAKALDGQGFL